MDRVITDEERAENVARIKKHVEIFELPEDALNMVVRRMTIYVEKYLCPPAFQMDFTQLAVSAKEMEKIQRSFVQLNEAVNKWKDDVFFERLDLEVSIWKPGAFEELPGPENRS